MTFSANCNSIFDKCIATYHETDNVNTEISNPFSDDNLDHWLYLKNWIDTVQWHFEDIIRDPNIKPIEALKIKRKIDASNQERTDVVEYLDSYFYEIHQGIKHSKEVRLNTETPAWAIDKLSILALKIYHMREESERQSASMGHKESCLKKLNILLEQRTDLSQAIDQLLNDLEKGKVKMKMYKQMKMYNDPSLNPVLYKAE